MPIRITGSANKLNGLVCCCAACATSIALIGAIAPIVTLLSPLPPGPAAHRLSEIFQPSRRELPFQRPTRAPGFLKACLKVRTESIVLSKADSLPNFAHHVKVKVDVVVGVKDGC